MPHPERMIPEDQAKKILEKADYGVLSMMTPEGAPYGIPINYVYVPEENIIFFHCAKSGRKIDCLTADNRVSLAVVTAAQIVPERFITHYESAIAAGRARLVKDPDKAAARLLQLCRRFAPEAIERRQAVIEKYLSALFVVEIDVESVSGKRNQDD